MSRAITLSVLRPVVDVVSGDVDDSNFVDQKQPGIVSSQTDAEQRSIQSGVEAPTQHAVWSTNESDSVMDSRAVREPVEAQEAERHSTENSMPLATPETDTNEGGPVPETPERGSDDSGTVAEAAERWSVESGSVAEAPTPMDALTPEGPVVPRFTLRTAVSMVVQKALRLFGLNHPGSWQGSVESDVGGTKEAAAGESLASEVGAIIEGDLLADASGITVEASITTAPDVDEQDEEEEQRRLDEEKEQCRLDEEKEQRKRLHSIEEATKLVRILALRWYRETIIGPLVLEEPKKDTRLVKTPTILQVVSPPPLRITSPTSRPTSARQVHGIQVYLAPLLGPVRETYIKESSPNFLIRGIQGTKAPTEPKEERKLSLRTAATEMMAEALKLYLERYKQTLSQHALMVHQITSKQKEEEEVVLTKEERGERLLDVLRRMSVRALRMYAEDTREIVQPDEEETFARVDNEEVTSTEDEYFSETIPEDEFEKLHPDVQLRLRLATLTGEEFGLLSVDQKLLVNLAQTANDEFDELTEDEKAQVLAARKTVTEIPDIKKVLQEKRIKKIRRGKRPEKRRVRKTIKTFQIPVEHELTVGKGRFRSHALGQPSPRRGIHPASQGPHPPQHAPKTRPSRPRPKQKRVARRPAHPAHRAKGRVGAAKPIAKPDTASLKSDEGKRHKKPAKTSDRSEEASALRSSKTEDEILAREFADIYGVDYTDYHRGSQDHKLSLLNLVKRPSLLKKVLRRRKRTQRRLKDILAKATYDVEDSISLRFRASETDSLMSLSEEEDISEMELAAADKRLSEEGVDLELVICKC